MSFIETCFMTQHRVYPGKCSTCTGIECVLLVVGAVFCKWKLGPVGYSCLHVFYMLTDFLFTDSINY